MPIQALRQVVPAATTACRQCSALRRSLVSQAGGLSTPPSDPSQPHPSTSGTSSKRNPPNPPSPSTKNNPITHFHITQLRSSIALPKPVKEALAGLGLRRRMHEVIRQATPGNAGKILKVKELVSVRNLTEEEAAEEMRLLERGRGLITPEERGYVKVGRIGPGGEGTFWSS